MPYKGREGPRGRGRTKAALPTPKRSIPNRARGRAESQARQRRKAPAAYRAPKVYRRAARTPGRVYQQANRDAARARQRAARRRKIQVARLKAQRNAAPFSLLGQLDRKTGKARPYYGAGVTPAQAQRIVRESRQQAARYRRQESAHRFLQGVLRETGRKPLVPGGFDAAGVHSALLRGQEALLSVPYQVTRAFAEDPGSTAKGTWRGAKDTIRGIPTAAYQLVTDPKEAFSETVADYKRRYGPLVSGDQEAFRARLKKEGAFSEVLDIGAGAGIAGRAVGLAKAPAPRPRLRVSGGGSIPQRASRNVNTRLIQSMHDKARAARTTRQIKRAGPAGRLGPLERTVRPGEVIPLRQKRAQRVAVARRKSRAVQALKAEQGRELKAARKNLRRLTKPERAGFKYALTLGLPAHPGIAAQRLQQRRAQIVAQREAAGTQIPEVLAKTNDELRQIDKLLANPEKVFTPRLRQVADLELARTEKIAARDPAMTPDRTLSRRYAQQAEMLGIERRQGESAGEFAGRVQQAAEGLTEPGYFPSQKRPTMNFAAHAAGGSKAVADDKRYTGSLFRTGREDTRAFIHEQGLAKNIKRKHNWRMVADNADSHVIRELGTDKKIGDLKDEIDRKGIDEGEVAFWNPGRFYAARNDADADMERTGGEEFVGEGVTEAVDAGLLSAKQAAALGDEFRESKGWSVIPKAVYDEIHADTRPSTKYARAHDVAKGKASRLLLGTSPPWLAYGVGSNVLLTGLAKTGPIDAVKGQFWWKGLDRKGKEGSEQYVGIGPAQFDIQQTKMGASVNNRFANAYRAFKEVPKVQAFAKLNPIGFMFRLDNAQNNFFRRAVLYSQVKRDAYNRIQKNAGLAMGVQARMAGMMTLGPKAQMRAILDEPDTFEAHANYLNKMLGDYATYTNKERRYLGRMVMFYGFLRFSLNWTFWTMPTTHPVVTAIVGNLAQLKSEEVRELLGGDELPFAFGRLYYDKDGKLHARDLGRLNPATNALVDARGPEAPLSMLPPFWTTTLDLMFGRSTYKGGQALRFNRETSYAAADRLEKDKKRGGLEANARYALSEMLSLAFPYRAAAKITGEGQPQGDDTLPWSQRRTRFKDKAIKRDLNRELKRQRKIPLRDKVIHELFPFLGHPSRDPEIVEAIQERKTGKKKKKKGSGSSGDWFGGGSSSGGSKKSSGGSWFD